MKACGRVAAFLFGTLIAGVHAWGQTPAWKPEKAVEIVVGTSPGGPQDRQGRLLQRVFQEGKLVNQAVNVVNKPGGGGAVSTVLAQVRAGRLRVLAIGAPRRWEGELASVPTWKELGIDSAQDLWRGLAGPKGLTPAQIAYWDATLARATREAEWIKDLERNLMVNAYRNSAETLKHWQQEYGEVKALFADMGLAK